MKLVLYNTIFKQSLGHLQNGILRITIGTPLKYDDMLDSRKLRNECAHTHMGGSVSSQII